MDVDKFGWCCSCRSTACRALTADPWTRSFVNSHASALRCAPIAWEKDGLDYSTAISKAGSPLFHGNPHFDKYFPMLSIPLSPLGLFTTSLHQCGLVPL